MRRVLVLLSVAAAMVLAASAAQATYQCVSLADWTNVYSGYGNPN